MLGPVLLETHEVPIYILTNPHILHKIGGTSEGGSYRLGSLKQKSWYHPTPSNTEDVRRPTLNLILLNGSTMKSSKLWQNVPIYLFSLTNSQLWLSYQYCCRVWKKITAVNQLWRKNNQYKEILLHIAILILLIDILLGFCLTHPAHMHVE